MKKAIRVILKIPATPVVVAFFFLMILAGYVCMFFEWVYEASNFDKEISRSLLSDYKKGLKKWFTTI